MKSLFLSMVLVGACVQAFAANPTTTTLTASTNAPRLGQTLTLTAAVATPSSGNVTFLDATSVVGIAPVKNGTAVMSTAALASGSHKLQARYDGDANDAKSLSAMVTVTVQSLAAINFYPLPAFGPTTAYSAIAADFNNDHIADLLTLQQDNSVAIYLGNGDGTFAAAPAVTVSCDNVAVGDFNEDGNLDLAFTVLQTDTVAVFFGAGDGTFSGPTTISVPGDGNVLAIATGDFNGDGALDILVSRNQSLALLPGNGDGTFGAAYATNPSFSDINGLVVGDFNGDGTPDVITISAQYGDFFVAGNGDGTFSLGVKLLNSSYFLGAADLNGDGKLDLVSQGYSNGTSVSLGNGDGTFGAAMSLDFPYTAVVDVNGDGKPDLVSGTNVGYGNGDGTFQPTIVFAPSTSAVLLAVADANNNGQIDLINEVSASAAGLNGISVFLGTDFSTVTLAVSPLPALYGSTISLSANVSPASATGTITYYDGAASLGSVPVVSGSAFLSTTPPASGHRVYSARYSGDNASRAGSSQPVEVLVLGTPTTLSMTASATALTYGQAITLTATITPSAASGMVTFYDSGAPIGTATLKAGTATYSTAALQTGAHSLTAQYDGGASYSASSFGSIAVSVTSLAAGTFGNATYAPGGTNPEQVYSADLNSDGLPDLLATTNTSFSVVLGTGSGTFASAVTYALKTPPINVVFGDFNNDGFADAAIQSNTSLTFMLGNGDGTLRPGLVLAVPNAILGVSDLNGDGSLDLVFAATSGSVSLLLGNGDGTFQSPLVLNAGYSLSAMAIADVNGDGKADLILCASPQYSGSSAVLLYPGNGDATFAAPRTVIQIPYPVAVVAGDLNRDGKVDLVVSANSSLVSLLGDGTGAFTVASTQVVNPLYSLLLADFNGDGILDVAGPEYSTLEAFFGNGDGTFSAIATGYLEVSSTFALGDFFQTGRVSIAAGGSSNGITLYAGVRPSTEILSTSPNPGTLGQPVKISVTISPSDATGTVTFYLGQEVLGTAPVVAGVAMLATSALPANRQAITYAYSGDSITAPYYSPYIYGYYLETITGLPSSMSLSSSSSAVTFGRPVTLSATISPAAATGTVTFFAGTQILGSSPLKSGVATFSSSLIPAGSSRVRAVYEGNDTYTAGTASNGLTILVSTVAGSTFRYVPSYFAISGTALAAGDLNGDGIQDLVVKSYNATTLEVLLGQTDGTFKPGPLTSISTYNPGNLPFPVMALDLNGDGKLDLVSPGYYDVMVSLGNGDGTFGQPISTYFTAIALASSDFDGDGIPDLVLLDVNRNIQVLRGVGDGTFFPLSQTFAAGVNNSNYPALVVADFNGDGKTDVAIAGYNANSVSIFLGNGDASFQPPADIAFGAGAGQLVATDLNGDGVPDLAVISGASNDTVTVLIGKGDGTFESPAAFPGLAASAISATDFNGDGKLDIIVGGAASTAVLYGNGDGTLQTAVVFPEGAPGLFVTDYNGDGRADVPALLGSLSDTIGISVTVSGQSVTLTASVLPDTATGIVTFYNGATVLGNVSVINGSAALTVKLPANGLQQITAKYLGDSNYAYVTSTSTPVTVSGAAGGSFTGPVQYPAGASPSAVVTADFNHDGKLDVAVANTNDNTVSVLWGNGDGTFGTKSTYATGTMPVALAAGDFNGDGISDLAVANAGSNNLTILLSSGGSLIPGVTVPISQSPFAIAAGDINGDGRVDLVYTGGFVGSGEPLLGNGDGTFTASLSALLTGDSQLVLNDFNGDRNPDVFLGYSEYLGDGHGGFSENATYRGEANVFTAADVNHDGILDAALVLFGSEAVSISLGKGDGTFLNPVSYPTPTAPIYLATGDFNGDGIPDIVLVNSSGTVGLMVGNGDGSFQPELAFIAGTQPIALAVGDFNGDGRLDLAVPNSGTNNVSILLGAATSCTFTVSPASFLFDETGGSAAVNVVASAPGCQWSANLVQSFTTVSQSTASGVGTGTFTLTIPPNNNLGATTASASINVANQRIPVTIRETTAQFADVPVSAYYFDAVNLLGQYNITAGCGLDDFCPNDTVTRAEMAIFLIRGILRTDDFTYTLTPYFTDVPPSAFGFQWIQKLKDLGITGGCGVNLFCPNDPVTRSDASIFLIRSRYGASTLFPYSATPYFADVPTSEYAFPWIQRMQGDDITAGCTVTAFCPDSPVIRGDMAIFIMRALFNQLLPVTEPVISSATYNSGPINLYLNAANTHFAQGTTQVTVPGLIVSNITVTGSNSLFAVATRNTSVPAGPESVVVITGQEVAVGPNLLNLQ